MIATTQKSSMRKARQEVPAINSSRRQWRLVSFVNGGAQRESGYLGGVCQSSHPPENS
jgi:hypothetical protein